MRRGVQQRGTLNLALGGFGQTGDKNDHGIRRPVSISVRSRFGRPWRAGGTNNNVFVIGLTQSK